jgi:hypothetical protein
MKGIDVTLKAIKLIEYLEKQGFSIDMNLLIISHKANRTAFLIEIEAMDWLKINYNFKYQSA